MIWFHYNCEAMMNGIMSQKISMLKRRAYILRVLSLKATTAAGSGHPTSALSCADIVAALFFYAMRYTPENPDAPDNDRFILSGATQLPFSMLRGNRSVC